MKNLNKLLVVLGSTFLMMSSYADEISNTPDTTVKMFLKDTLANFLSDEVSDPSNMNPVQNYTTKEFQAAYNKLIDPNNCKEDICLEYDIFVNGQDSMPIENYSFKIIEQKENKASVLTTEKWDEISTSYNCFQLQMVDNKWLISNIVNIFPGEKTYLDCKIYDFPALDQQLKMLLE